MVVVRDWRGGEKGGCYSVDIKFQLSGRLNSRDPLYNVVPLVNNTVSYT